VASQFSVKDQCHGSACYLTLNPICIAQRSSKNLKNAEDNVRIKRYWMGDLRDK
jgi:hypothetical protein